MNGGPGLCILSRLGIFTFNDRIEVPLLWVWLGLTHLLLVSFPNPSANASSQIMNDCVKNSLQVCYFCMPMRQVQYNGSCHLYKLTA